MTRTTATIAILLAAISSSALSRSALAQAKAAPQAGTNTITVVLPSLKSFYDDLKVPFDLVNDPKGYETLIDTLEVFVVGMESEQPLGIRVLSGPNGLSPAVTLPVRGGGAPGPINAKNDPQFQKMLENLWDLDLKTAPAPLPGLTRLIPAAIRTKLPGLKLAPAERLMFGGYDGFMRREKDAVQMAKELIDVRELKGLIPFPYEKGVDLGVTIDGKAQKLEDRLKAFEKVRKELLGALKKKADETQTAFDLRKASLEQLVAELERFYSESSEIRFLWKVDNDKKTAGSDVDISALPNTELEKSVKLVEPAPLRYAQVTTQNTVASANANMPFDDMRKKHSAEMAKLLRAHADQMVTDNKNRTDEQKKIDRDLLSLLFDVLDDVSAKGALIGCIRSWPAPGDRFVSLGAIEVTNSANIVATLQKLGAGGGNIKIEVGIENFEQHDIHRIVAPDVQKDLPEIISADGSIFLATGPGVLWYGSGDGVVDKIKEAIQASAAAPADSVPPLTVSVRLGPWAKFLKDWRERNPQAAKPKEAKKPVIQPGGQRKIKAPTAKGQGDEESMFTRMFTLLGDLNLDKLAADSLTSTDDVMSATLSRQEDKARLSVHFDTGLIRFVGNAMSKFVKDNLADE